MTDQTLKDIDRAFKALEERDELLDKIRAEIESLNFDFGDYYDHTDEIIDKVCKVIDKYKAEGSDKE